MIEEVSLHEVAKVFNGKTPSKKEQRENGHPVLKIKDVSETGEFRGPFESFVEHDFAKKHAKKRIFVGDVLVLNAAHNADYVGSKQFKATPGVEGAIATGEWLIARSDDPRLCQDFLWYWFQAPSTRFEIKKRVKGIHLYPRDVSDLQIPLPPIDEQHRIAAILDKADSIRRSRRQSLAYADDLLNSAFLEMFGDPEVNPKLWDRMPFQTLAEIDTKMVDPKHDDYIDLIHIGPDVIESQTGRILPARTARADGLKSGKYLFSGEHLLFTKIRPYLQKVALPDFVGICSADVYPIKARHGLSTREFLWAVLISPAYVTYFNKLPDRANIPKINMKEMNAYNCIAPPYELQEEFSKRFEEIERLRARLKEGFDEASDLFASLSQRAFSGEL